MTCRLLHRWHRQPSHSNTQLRCANASHRTLKILIQFVNRYFDNVSIYLKKGKHGVQFRRLNCWLWCARAGFEVYSMFVDGLGSDLELSGGYVIGA